MRELFDARLNVDDKPMTQAQLAEAVKVADVLVPTVTDRIDLAVIFRWTSFAFTANWLASTDHLDMRNRAIIVINTLASPRDIPIRRPWCRFHVPPFQGGYRRSVDLAFIGIISLTRMLGTTVSGRHRQ